MSNDIDVIDGSDYRDGQADGKIIGAAWMRERAAQWLESRADEFETGEDPSHISRTMARIYRDEANLVRNLPLEDKS